MKTVIRSLAAATLVFGIHGGAMAAIPSDTVWGSISLPDAIYDRHVIAMAMSGDGVSLSFTCAAPGYMAVLAPSRPRNRTIFETTEAQANVTWRVDKQPPVHETWRVIPMQNGTKYVLTSFDVDTFHDSISAGHDRLVVRVDGWTFFFPVAGAREELDRARTACLQQQAARTRR